MFLRILAKSFTNRKSRVAIAVIAVLMGASMTSGLLTVARGVEEKLGLEFRKFGSNIVVIPRSDTIEVGLPGMSFGSVTEQRYIDESDLWKIKNIDNWNANVLGFAPYLYQVVKVEYGGREHRLVLSGTYFEREIPNVMAAEKVWKTGVRVIAPYWQIEGSWIDDNDSGSVIAGISVADKLNLKLGDYVNVSYENPETRNMTIARLKVMGTVSTGGLEDSQLFVTLAAAQKISGRLGKVHSVQVSGLCVNCPAESIAAEIEKKVPYVQAKSVKQLVRAEAKIMEQLGQMMMLIAIVALVASGLCVMTTMTTTVIERRKEIGLMKSIGAENRKIASIFLAESMVIGVVGGLFGYFLGNVLAQSIGDRVFGASIPPLLFVLPLTVGISLSVAFLASIVPVRCATRMEPAVVLRGE